MTARGRWARRGAVVAAAFFLMAAAGWWLIGPDWRGLIAHPPSGRDALSWSRPQRDAAFRMLDRLWFAVEARKIEAGGAVHPLPTGAPLPLPMDIDAYMADQHTAAIVVVQDGRVRLERYGLGFGADGRWTSFSVAKSFSSTLVGAALADGAIRSLDDKVTDYIPALAGSAYDDVTVAQLLTMTSGVAWTEDYEDPDSDVARFDTYEPAPGESATVGYMRTLARAHPPGTQWHYSTGETNLVGVLVSEATGMPIADYLSKKIWRPFGMEQKATWLLGADGHEIGGCCIQATPRDFARFGLFILGGGATPEGPVLPPGWLDRATRKQADYGVPGEGYGFQWWTWDDGSFQADGIFGQGIFIDPARRLVIASNSNWSSAEGMRGGEYEQRAAFYRAVQAAVDAESPAGTAD